MLTEERTGLNAELARNRDDLAATQVSYAQDKAACAPQLDCSSERGECSAEEDRKGVSLREDAAECAQEDPSGCLVSPAARRPPCIGMLSSRVCSLKCNAKKSKKPLGSTPCKLFHPR